MSGTLIHLGALPSRSEGSAAPESRATASTAPSPAVRPERDLPLEPVAAAAQLRRLPATRREAQSLARSSEFIKNTLPAELLELYCG